MNACVWVVDPWFLSNFLNKKSLCVTSIGARSYERDKPEPRRLGCYKKRNNMQIGPVLRSCCFNGTVSVLALPCFYSLLASVFLSFHFMYSPFSFFASYVLRAAWWCRGEDKTLFWAIAMVCAQ